MVPINAKKPPVVRFRTVSKRQNVAETETSEEKSGGDVSSPSKAVELSDVAMFRCEECPVAYSTQDLLDQHTERSHQRGTGVYDPYRPFPCWDCGKRFKKRTVLVAHMKTHSGEASFLCEYCGKAFNQRAGLSKHINTAHLQVKYTCDLCKKAFTTKDYLHNHTATVHHGRKDFICRNCGKQFTTAQNLGKHRVRAHSGTPQKKVICKECGESFAYPDGLRNHALVQHRGEKPYKCRYCEDSFKNSYQRKTHEVRIHTKEYHQCSVCDLGFTVLNKLKRHMKSVHNIELDKT